MLAAAPATRSGHPLTPGETNAARETASQRFAFGRNWSRFLTRLEEEKIQTAEDSLRATLGVENLSGKTFLDVGSGSGLFSLAARRLGARVYSFDYDPQSVACTRLLQRRYFPGGGTWTVTRGSVLAPGYLESLGTFDIVYAWGVLHHTGDMWQALNNVAGLVAPGGKLVLAIYNDRGKVSRRWRSVKRAYNSMPSALRLILVTLCLALAWWRPTLKDFLLFRPFRTWRDYGKERGMSAWHDMVDWVGGYPYEVARPEEIFDFNRRRGFVLTGLRTAGCNLGCNEFVFSRPPVEKQT